MDQDLFLRDLRTIENSMSGFLSNGMDRMKWFVSFGTLLYLIRDKKQSLPFETDFDVSIVGEHDYKKIEGYLLDNKFTFKNCIKDDFTKEVYNAHFDSPNGLHLDLFFWISSGRNYWHTYDYMADASDGIPSKYHFKNVPSYMFEGETIKYRWFEDMSPLRIPQLYGTLLDYWYPNWIIPDPDFGVSKCEKIYEPSNCANLKENLCSLA